MVGDNIIERLVKPLKNKSFFLFGVRGTGKTTYLERGFTSKNSIRIDLLDPVRLDEFSLDPARFRTFVLSPEHKGKLIIVDEVQRLPKLLDYVHQLIESHRIQFALTGSSARRLKQTGVNLLAGRAIVYDLFPFNSFELGASFDLDRYLHRGGLPESYLAASDEYSTEYLRSYGLTYLEKEIQQEQWVRKLDPFRKFLQIASQMNGKPINRSSIARDVGVDDMTVESYFQILADTLMGVFLPAYHRSVRKQQRQAAKFYFIDPGIKRALDRTLRVPLLSQSSDFGQAFEHWVFLELYKQSSYMRLDWEFHYIRTKDDAEIDLVIKRPGERLLLIEIKSATKVFEKDAKTLETLGHDLEKHSERILISRDPLTHQFGKTLGLYWETAFKKIFFG